ncbi:thiamine-phosphate kinase [Novilysobacter selenitireducens]|uniref:Thiamine-monophosphate kinase n=1 Tax=Novilysobacter selenitireducens TaxID=2872639 RepID=A0ABS7T3K8_9GAMM|nr:thiamine-phosphate kinase [Lysobacter selenitireducens]MBZ4038456.1 thiamine-phosphate kinase [Lysobacter selenitireducens]
MEFDLIQRIRQRATTRDDVVLGIGDDAALLQPPAGRQLVVAMDTLNAGVHFPVDTAPADIGWKALAVNLSDLAAMGAEPAWCTLSLSLPDADAAWVDGFLDGFLELADRHRVSLVGGDTTRGPLSVCVTMHGFVEPGRALRRDGAHAGEDVWVTGTLGDAAAALSLLLPLPPGEGRGEGPAKGSTPQAVVARPDLEPSPQPLSRGERGSVAQAAALMQRLHRPTPRAEAGLALVDIAHAAIDISDGLLADVGHIARASGVSIHIDADVLPTSDPLRATFGTEVRRALQATGGDDYELCFTAPVHARDRIASLASSLGLGITRIGRVEEGEGTHAHLADGTGWHPRRIGYSHFEG